MKRLLVSLLVLAAALVPLLAQQHATHAASPARAAAAPSPISGRLFLGQNPATAVPAAGVRIELRSGPGGKLIGATTTNSEGRFWVTRSGALPKGGSYVKVVARPTVQGGIIGGSVSVSPKYVQPSYTYGTRYADGTSLGRIYALPAYVRGKLVDATTLAPIPGATVRLRHAADNTIAHYATTDADGLFRMTSIKGEDFNLQVVGSPVGYESGYRSCSAQVVPTVGDACQSPIGDIGRVYVDAGAA